MASISARPVEPLGIKGEVVTLLDADLVEELICLFPMKKSRFNETQIIGVLREQEAGSPTAEVCRRHGISEQTFYRWKAKYSGMTVSDAQKLRTLEDENRRLKKLLAESMLDVSALKDLLGKN